MDFSQVASNYSHRITRNQRTRKGIPAVDGRVQVFFDRASLERYSQGVACQASLENFIRHQHGVSVPKEQVTGINAAGTLVYIDPNKSSGSSRGNTSFMA